MTRICIRRLSWFWVLVLALCATAAQAQEFRYRYVSLDDIVPPPPYTLFIAESLQDSGRIYGTVCDDLCSDPRIAFYKDGKVTVLKSSGFAGPVNARGTVGGAVLTDPENFVYQAALFHGDKVELIPPQPGEFYSSVISINDRDMALVESFTDVAVNYVLYKDGKASLLDFSPAISFPGFLSRKSINNHGIIAGISRLGFADARGFSFDPRTGQAMLLHPFPGDRTETTAWSMGINNRGDVLGYSYTQVPPYHERIGVWKRDGHFKTYSVSPICTNRLLFNDNDLIVATRGCGHQSSYLIPRPGVRFDLADLVENLPQGTDLFFISDLNNRGDMIGFVSFMSEGSFLLQRIDTLTLPAAAASRPASRVKSTRRNLPPKAAAILRRQFPSFEELK